MTLKQQFNDDMKAAMRSSDKQRLGVIRLALAAIKQREIDECVELDDPQIIAVLEKMLKQRRDSVTQYVNAEREDLADQERFEIDVIGTYLPEPLDAAELDALIETAIRDSGAESMRDMAKVLAIVKQQAAGRVDMTATSALIKARLGS